MTAVGKIVVVGASGLVGAKVVDILRANGLEVLPASRRTGIDVLTGDGLADALRDAQVVVDGWNVSVVPARAPGVSIAPNMEAQPDHWPSTGLRYQTIGLR